MSQNFKFFFKSFKFSLLAILPQTSRFQKTWPGFFLFFSLDIFVAQKSKFRFHMLKIKKEDNRSPFNVTSTNVIKYQISSASWYTRWFFESLFLSSVQNYWKTLFLSRGSTWRFSVFSLVSPELDVHLCIKVTYFNYEDETLEKVIGGRLGQFLLCTSINIYKLQQNRSASTQ